MIIARASAERYGKHSAMNWMLLRIGADEICLENEARVFGRKRVAGYDCQPCTKLFRHVDSGVVGIRFPYGFHDVVIFSTVYSRHADWVPCFEFGNAIEGFVHLIADDREMR